MKLITGKDCEIEIDGQSYTDRVASFEIKPGAALTYKTLQGKLSTASSDGTLTIRFAYDSGETNSLFDALWAAAEAGTPILYAATVGKSSFAGVCNATQPNVPANGDSASEVSVDLELDGAPEKSLVV